MVDIVEKLKSCARRLLMSAFTFITSGAVSLSSTPGSPLSSIGSTPPDILVVKEPTTTPRPWLLRGGWRTNCLLSTSQEWR
jgi:hypothetical protein